MLEERMPPAADGSPFSAFSGDSSLLETEEEPDTNDLYWEFFDETNHLWKESDLWDNLDEENDEEIGEEE